MLRVFLSKGVLFFILAMVSNVCFSQSVYAFAITKNKESCLKAGASLEIQGTAPADTVDILWSNGQVNTKQVYELISGDYSVNIKIKHLQDTVVFSKDTTLYFFIEKEFCQVFIDNYFSPNDDNYHDVLGISNVQYYPNFEFRVFNKWGQQVHLQKQTFLPWDGQWNGINQPDGAYYYVFFYDAENKNKLTKGSITILR